MGRTLSAIMDAMLPDVNRARLQDAFWISKANFVLDEITTKLNGPLRNIEAIVPLVEGVTVYDIPNKIRKLERLRYASSANLGLDVSDFSTPIGFSIIGPERLRISSAPSLNGNPVLIGEQGLPNSEPTNINCVEFPISGHESWPLDLSGWAATITHYAPRVSLSDPAVEIATEDLIIAHRYDTVATIGVRLNGNAVLPIIEGDKITINSNFMIASGNRRFPHFTAINSASPLPDEWDRIIGKGLRFYLEMQQEEDGSGPSVAKFDEVFRRDIEEIESDYADLSGDVAQVQPRSPAMYGSLRRRR